MTDENSGDVRAQQAQDSADALRAQARELEAQAKAAERRGQAFASGAAGERDIGRLLDQLLAEGWLALHDRRVSNNSPANLDHVVVGPAGAFVIDTKNWTGGRVRFDDRGMVVAAWRKDDELHAVKVQGDVVAASAQQVRPGTPVHAVIAFVQDMGLDRPTLHQSVVVLQREQLVGWLRALPTTLTPGEVVTVYRGLERRHPPRSLRPGRGRGPRVPNPATVSRGGQPNRRPPVGRRPQPGRQGQPRGGATLDRERRALLLRLLAVTMLLFVLTQTTLLSTLVTAFGQAASGAITERVTHDPTFPAPPAPPDPPASAR